MSINGRDRHVYSYLRDFLFSSQRAKVPVRALSGGERNRLLLAKLFTKPANLMVLDEPTNDLDSDTLELLESLLMEYQGTLIIVSHDRAFLNNVITSSLVFENGELNEYVGGYDDWLRQRKEPVDSKDSGKKPQQQKIKSDKEPKSSDKNNTAAKLTFSEQKELEKLPAKIEQLEEQQTEIEAEIAEPDFYQQEKFFINKKLAELEDLNRELENTYQRWELLEAKK